MLSKTLFAVPVAVVALVTEPHSLSAALDTTGDAAFAAIVGVFLIIFVLLAFDREASLKAERSSSSTTYSLSFPRRSRRRRRGPRRHQRHRP
ncbi:MAG TPA: hypothetical protein VNV44_07980 [Solirubrobacteraceae bacterium]|nr:hypothetical protein [Solirubrobacteraceae bacterium]